MSNTRKAILITVAIMACILGLSLFGVAATEAAPQKTARIYHRNGTVEILDNVTYVRVLDERLKGTSIIEICSNDKRYRFFNAEVEIETDERKVPT